MGPKQFVQGLKSQASDCGFYPNAPVLEALKQGDDIP